MPNLSTQAPQSPIGPNPVIGTASIVSVTPTQINLRVMDASGQNTPITYQWYRGTTSSFTVSSSSLITGLVGDFATDTPPNNSTYYYCCVATDAAQRTSTSNIIEAAISTASSEGSSISADDISSAILAEIAPELAMILEIYPQTNLIPSSPIAIGDVVSISIDDINAIGLQTAQTFDNSSAILPQILTQVNKIKNPVQIDFTQVVPMSNGSGTIGDALNAARAQSFGNWTFTGTALNLYGSDGTTIVKSFTLDNPTSPTSRT